MSDANNIFFNLSDVNNIFSLFRLRRLRRGFDPHDQQQYEGFPTGEATLTSSQNLFIFYMDSTTQPRQLC